MRYDRLISIVLIALGFALLVFSFVSDASAHSISAMRYTAFDMISLSWISFLFPRSNADLKREALSGARFIGLALGTIGFVAISVYLIAGMPSTVSDELMMSIVVIALPAAIIVPVIAKSFQQKWARAQ